MNTQNWGFDALHSEVNFKVKHMMVSTVTGTFNSYDVKVTTDGEDFTTAQVEFSADINSISTRNEDRDNHLKSDDFFNANEFPHMTFKSKEMIKDGEDFKLVGDLTIRDVTKEVTLDVEFNGVAVDPYGQTKAGFEINGNINRKEFGLRWDAVTEAGSIVVSDKVKIDINLQLVKLIEEAVEA